MTEYPIPSGIPTHVTVPELRLLQCYAHEAGSVLEIGTLYGYTAIGMALAGASVTTVDPHTGGPADAPDTWEQFLSHCQRHDYESRKPIADEGAVLLAWEPNESGSIYAYRSFIELFNTPPSWQYHRDFGELAPFPMVFIDGDHVHPAPMRDARIALAYLRAPGYVAFHDVTPVWMDVWLAVRELERSGQLVKLAQERYLAVYQAAGYQRRASGVSGRSSTPIVAE